MTDPKHVALVLEGVTYPTWGAFTRGAAALLKGSPYLSAAELNRMEDIYDQEGCDLGTFSFQIERFTFRIEPRVDHTSKKRDGNQSIFLPIHLDYKVDNPSMGSMLLAEAVEVAEYLETGCNLLRLIQGNFQLDFQGNGIHYLFQTEAEKKRLEADLRNQDLARELVEQVLQKVRLKVGAAYAVKDPDLDDGQYSVTLKKRLFTVTASQGENANIIIRRES